jgi:hypothetical protein
MAQAVVWGQCPFQFPDITTTVLTANFYGLRHPVQENALVISEVHLNFSKYFLLPLSRHVLDRAITTTREDPCYKTFA